MSGDYELSSRGSGSGGVAVYSPTAPRRRWSAELKAQIVAESYATTVAETAARHGLSKTQIFTWRRASRLAQAVDFAAVELESTAQPAATGLIELQIGQASMRVGPGADPKMATALVMALKAGR